MDGFMCNGCGELIPIGYACATRIEGDSGEDMWDYSVYHMGCEVNEVCEDCQLYREVCDGCAESVDEKLPREQMTSDA